MTVLPRPKLPDTRTFQDIEVRMCTEGGVSHDYRGYVHMLYGRQTCSWRCVWCHALSCGSYDDPDPCTEPQGHIGPHITKADQ